MAAEENVAFGAYISRKRIQDPVSIKHLKSDTTCQTSIELSIVNFHLQIPFLWESIDK